MAAVQADIGIIGGSGFYELLEDAVDVTVHTPYGAPSSALSVGEVGGLSVAFLPRHGRRHELPPHRVNYRANLWALRSIGVRRVFGPSAVGSLRPDLAPGHFVVLDQLVDRTSGRPDTFLDGPVVGHVSFADPYCAELSAALFNCGSAQADTIIHPRGTVVVIQGPRFSTRAESAWFRRCGWDVVNMTQYPEAYLARELGMCFAGLALITDYDTGVELPGGVTSSGAPEAAQPVTMDAVMAVLRANVARSRQLLIATLPTLPAERSCGCAAALPHDPFTG